MPFSSLLCRPAVRQREDFDGLDANKRAEMHDENQPAELPNGPAKVTTDPKKDRFKLDYGGENIFQATVKIVREEKELSFRDAAARLFVVSKFDGWDVVTQSIRIAAVATQPGDTLILRGHAPHSGTAIATEPASTATGIYCPTHDWLLAVDSAAESRVDCEEVAVKSDPDTKHQRITLTAGGPEIILSFRPYYRQRHGAKAE